MARQIKINQIGNFSGEMLDKLLGKTMLQLDKRIKQESPVDTGRFRLSWSSWQGNPNEYDADPSGRLPSQKKGDPFSSPPSTPDGGFIQRRNYTRESHQSTYFLSNSLPYAGKLATGSSQQAPKGWVETAVKEMENWIENQAGKTR